MRDPLQAPTAERLAAYQAIRDHVAKGALSMIDHANHKPANAGKKPKVGGHQASSMSSVDILMALYLHMKRPHDKIAVKPHAAPVLYSLMHLLGELPLSAMSELREMGGPQPYPTKLKNPRFVDYTTSSEALGVCAAIYDAYGAVLHNRQVHKATGSAPTDSVYYGLCGDGELTEGQIDESLYDAGRWGLNNLLWVVDLNRQSLDRVMDDSGRLESWVSAKFKGQGWDVHTLRWGARAKALFARRGGDALQEVLETLPDPLAHALLLVDGAAARALLTGADAGSPTSLMEVFRVFGGIRPTQYAGIKKALEGLDDATLADGLRHLGGHDLGALIDALITARSAPNGPAVVIAHTVKGFETSAAAHPENHGALLSVEEVAGWGLDRGLPPEISYPVPAPDSPAGSVLQEVRSEAFDGPDHGWAASPVDAAAAVSGIRYAARKNTSSGEAFQSLNLAALRTELAPFMQFGAPDVGQTTHLGPVIKATGVFAPRHLPDTFAWLRESRSVAFDWRPSDAGQFHAMGIAEGNAMLWAYAFGRRRKGVEGQAPLLPIITVYDKFFERGLNQLDYAVYSGARFLAVGVPSGTGLSRETATHQSLSTMRMVMDLPGILAYEPAFGADLAAIYRHALGQLWAPSGEAIYLRLTTQSLAQPTEWPDDHAEAAIRGGYWLVGEDKRPPGPDGETVLFVASGRKLAQVRGAAARLSESGIGSRILNVTSYEALWRDWDAYANDPNAWSDPSRSYHVHDLFADADVNAPLIMTGDHVASVCEWLPGAMQRARAYRFLGPRTNGEAGALEAVDALHGMGVDDLVAAATSELKWRRELRNS